MHVTCSSYFNVFILVSRLVSYQSDAETAKIKKKKRAALVEERYMSGLGLLMGRALDTWRPAYLCIQGVYKKYTSVSL